MTERTAIFCLVGVLALITAGEYSSQAVGLFEDIFNTLVTFNAR